MVMRTMTIEVKIRWWLPVYIKTLMLFCLMSRREPDYEKVSAFIAKHGICQKLNVGLAEDSAE